MIFALLGFATVLAIIWFVLLGMVNGEDWTIAAYNKVLINREAIKKLIIKNIEKKGKLSQYHGFSKMVMSLFLSGDPSKEIANLERDNEALQNGDLRKVSLFALPGYVILRKVEALSKGTMHKNILMLNTELYGRKNAVNKTKQLIAGMLSYPIISISLALIISSLCISSDKLTMGYTVLGVGALLIFVLIYAMYDDVNDKANKRRAAISRQFPNVASKLALLVTSGMIMNRAWNETAYSQELELYHEMRMTSDELDNLVAPEIAYSNFITRCNTKETTKLASAILQNLSKGNAEIGKLLKDLAKEAWLERRHLAMRDAEKANSKLMIPTMLLFLAILIMIMAPISMNFGGIQ